MSQSSIARAFAQAVSLWSFCLHFWINPQTWNPGNCDFFVMDASKGSKEWKFFKDYVLTKGPPMNPAAL